MAGRPGWVAGRPTSSPPWLAGQAGARQARGAARPALPAPGASCRAAPAAETSQPFCAVGPHSAGGRAMQGTGHGRRRHKAAGRAGWQALPWVACQGQAHSTTAPCCRPCPACSPAVPRSSCLALGPPDLPCPAWVHLSDEALHPACRHGRHGGGHLGCCQRCGTLQVGWLAPMGQQRTGSASAPPGTGVPDRRQEEAEAGW